MPNTSTPATAEGLPAMNRRWFLTSAPVAAAALSIPAVAVAAPAHPTAQARFEMHLEGLKQAMQEIDPTIKGWSDYGNGPVSPELRCRFALMAYNYDPKELS
jgi:hypothetical protein